MPVVSEGQKHPFGIMQPLESRRLTVSLPDSASGVNVGTGVSVGSELSFKTSGGEG